MKITLRLSGQEDPWGHYEVPSGSNGMLREDLNKKHCKFYDKLGFWPTYLPHPNWDKMIYDNLIRSFDLTPLLKFRQIPENIWF